MTPLPKAVTRRYLAWTKDGEELGRVELVAGGTYAETEREVTIPPGSAISQIVETQIEGP